jgi:N-acyl amino acid synthase of PEP-CTERM/exosortase system
MRLHTAAASSEYSLDRGLPDQQYQTEDTPWNCFPHYFQAMLANTASQKQDIYRLRHKVYCEELGFEPVRPDGLEQDSFDCRSLHASISHNASSKLAGTVRIITAEYDDELLPIEQHFSSQITNTMLAPQNFNRQHICEISRLAVPAEIRYRAKARQNGQSAMESECCKMVAISLYLLATLMCIRTRRVHAYVMVEPALARVLRRVGIQFVQIGNTIDYNGVRAPYYLDMRTTGATLKSGYLQLRNMFESQLYARQPAAWSQIKMCYSAASLA